MPIVQNRALEILPLSPLDEWSCGSRQQECEEYLKKDDQYIQRLA